MDLITPPTSSPSKIRPSEYSTAGEALIMISRTPNSFAAMPVSLRSPQENPVFIAVCPGDTNADIERKKRGFPEGTHFSLFQYPASPSSPSPNVNSSSNKRAEEPRRAYQEHVGMENDRAAGRELTKRGGEARRNRGQNRCRDAWLASEEAGVGKRKGNGLGGKKPNGNGRAVKKSANKSTASSSQAPVACEGAAVAKAQENGRAEKGSNKRKAPSAPKTGGNASAKKARKGNKKTE
ncbi:MAG: hypothetical protein M1821_003729 [Bathelium mastoideum]|nr:MAG: hypothetical protein M1821_003729 [Bathelium mastoideum]